MRYPEMEEMIRNRALLLIGIVLAFTSCSLAPKYDRPQAPVPSLWPSGSAYGYAPEERGFQGASELGWRDFFVDGKLQELIKTALENNRDLRLAALNVQRARALYGIQRGELFPSLSSTGSGSSERIPADLSSTGQVREAEQYRVNLGVTAWEIDFFGRIRSLEERSLEEFFATEQANRSAQVLLIAAVANAYLTMAADRESLGLAEKTLAAQKESYDLVKRRYELGLASELDLNRAQTQVDAARGDIWRFTQFVAQDENALALLMGGPLRGDKDAHDLASVVAPEVLSPGTSSEILLNRPDVIAAEHRLKAAYANIGAARASLFPRISLTTSVGTASAELSGLFHSGSGTWLFAPQISVPIFDSRLWAAYDVTKVEREISLAQYEKAIQTAFREVADSLALKGTIDRQLSTQQSLADAVERTYRLSKLRYDKGLDSYLAVLDAQRSLYAAQQGLVSLRLAGLANRVKLYAALGGGWQEKTAPVN